MNHAVFQLKNVHFWREVINEIRHWWAQVTFQGHHASDPAVARPLTIQNVKNTRSSLSSSFLLLPSPFPFSSLFSSWPPKTLQFIGKNAKIVIMMSIFDPTRGSYSLGRVLLRRNTLYKLRIRESEKLKTGLELYDLETHEKKLGPDYHRLKAMVKRSIEQEIRNKNFGARSGHFEKNAVVKNQGTKQRVQRILGDCWQWETNGQCVKGNNCSFRHDMNKRGKSSPSNPSPNSFMQQSERKPSRTRSPRGRSPSGRMSRWPCKDYLKGTCNNSLCEKWHPPECLYYKTKSGCRFGEKCSFAHRQVDEQPTKKVQIE